jgi:ornithine cyclodeaminase
LRFPDQPQDRIISLPAYLGTEQPGCGLKWISSFPGNASRNMDRASAVLILNSLETGRAQAIMEGSAISAQRTAASAALATQAVHSRPHPESVGLIGCGLINHEIARFLNFVFPGLEKLILFDTFAGKAESMASIYRDIFPDVTVAHRLHDVLSNCEIVSFATTASTPHVYDLSACQHGTTILHVSLRDLSPQVILAADNVVDDQDHVCRASTSLHLAEQETGSRSFIRCSLGEILSGRVSGRTAEQKLVVFSPFGLGILDLAVALLVMRVAREQGYGMRIADFHPESWTNSNAPVESESTCQEASA